MVIETCTSFSTKKSKAKHGLLAHVFHAWHHSHVHASSSDWFIVLFASVVIGQSNYFSLILRHTTEDCSNRDLHLIQSHQPENQSDFPR